MDPFTSLLDLDVGTITSDHGALAERRLRDMRGMYAAEPDDPDLVTYRVLPIQVPPTNGNVLSSTTILEPGDVGGEYFMTKGHFHAIRDRAEIYVGLAGEGRLVLATGDGRWDVQPMRRGTVNYVPGHWAHRSVNVGDTPLVFFAAYPADAGYDYETIERRGFPVRVVRGPDGPEVVENPGYRSA